MYLFKSTLSPRITCHYPLVITASTVSSISLPGPHVFRLSYRALSGTWFRQSAANCDRRGLNLCRKTRTGIELVCGKRRVWRRRLKSLKRRKGCRRAWVRHQAIPRSRPRLEAALGSDTGVQLPERSRIRSRGHRRCAQMRVDVEEYDFRNMRFV